MDKSSEGRRCCCCGCAEPLGWQGWWGQLGSKGEGGMAGRGGFRGWSSALPTLRRNGSMRIGSFGTEEKNESGIADEYFYSYMEHCVSFVSLMQDPLISTPTTRCKIERQNVMQIR